MISGTTRVAAVIGSPVRHSLSPAIHNAAFAANGLDWVYTAFEVAPGAAVAALDGMRAFGIAGLSVTMPHKEAVASAVDSCNLLAFQSPTLAALRDVLLPKLVTGAIDVSHLDLDALLEQSAA